MTDFSSFKSNFDFRTVHYPSTKSLTHKDPDVRALASDTANYIRALRELRFECDTLGYEVKRLRLENEFMIGWINSRINDKFSED